MAITQLKRIQVGKETDWGEKVTPTAWLQGLQDATLRYADETEPLEELGRLSPSALARKKQVSGEGSIVATATYEDILYFCHPIFGPVFPAGTGPYTWTYMAPVTTAPTPQSYTIEFGAPDAVYAAVGSLFTKLTVEAEAGDFWKVSSDLLVRHIEPRTVLTMLPARDVLPILAAETGLSVDPWDGIMGTTSVPATLIAFGLDVETTRHLKHMMGHPAPAAWGEGPWTGELRLTLELNANAKEYVNDLLSDDEPVLKQIEIKAQHGSGAAQRAAQLQFCGVLTEGVELFSDRDGNVTVDLTFRGLYNPTFGGWLKVVATNGINSLP